MPITHITVRGARQHNLRDVNVQIPRNTLTVVTGLSGSGNINNRTNARTLTLGNGNATASFSGTITNTPLSGTSTLNLQKVGAGTQTIRWSPPLILTKENVDVALEIFDAAIAASV